MRKRTESLPLFRALFTATAVPVTIATISCGSGTEREARHGVTPQGNMENAKELTTTTKKTEQPQIHLNFRVKQHDGRQCCKNFEAFEDCVDFLPVRLLSPSSSSMSKLFTMSALCYCETRSRDRVRSIRLAVHAPLTPSRGPPVLSEAPQLHLATPGAISFGPVACSVRRNQAGVSMQSEMAPHSGRTDGRGPHCGCSASLEACTLGDQERAILLT